MPGADAIRAGVGRLAQPMPLAELVGYVAGAAARPPPAAYGPPATRTGWSARLAVAGGAGDGFLADATAAGVDAFLTADLRHHPASEHLAGGGPALLDAATLGHRAAVARRRWPTQLRADLAVDVVSCHRRGSPTCGPC